MISNYFGDIERGEHPCKKEEIPKNVWLGIKTNIENRIGKNSFSVDQAQFYDLLEAELPNLKLPLTSNPPTRSDILELIQFCHKYIDHPTTQKFRDLSSYEYAGSYGSLEYAGQAEFEEFVNLIFYRNSILYRLEHDGKIKRAIPQEMQNIIQNSEFNTEDPTFNELMDTARKKFLNPDIETRKEALEKLWDAWQRLKSFEPGKDTKDSIEKLLNKVSKEPKFFEVLNKDAHALSDIGNDFMIRHTEKNKVKIDSPNQIDYFFYRLFSLIYYILKSTNRMR